MESTKTFFFKLGKMFQKTLKKGKKKLSKINNKNVKKKVAQMTARDKNIENATKNFKKQITATHFHKVRTEYRLFITNTLLAHSKTHIVHIYHSILFTFI